MVWSSDIELTNGFGQNDVSGGFTAYLAAFVLGYWFINVKTKILSANYTLGITIRSVYCHNI